MNLVLPKVSSKKENEEVIEVWDEEELDTIISDSKGHRLHFLLLLASQTGLRIGELLSLTYDDIEDDMLKVTKQLIRKPLFKNGKMTESVLSVSNTKTKSSVRSIPLSSDTIKALEEHKKWQTEDMMKYGYRTEYLFTTKFGNYYDNSSLRVSCNRLYKKIGIQPRSFHVYRHTFGTNLAKNGVPIQVVSELMGHSDINVTAKYYINIDKDEKRNAINKLNC